MGIIRHYLTGFFTRLYPIYSFFLINVLAYCLLCLLSSVFNNPVYLFLVLFYFDISKFFFLDKAVNLVKLDSMNTKQHLFIYIGIMLITFMAIMLDSTFFWLVAAVALISESVWQCKYEPLSYKKLTILCLSILIFIILFIYSDEIKQEIDPPPTIFKFGPRTIFKFGCDTPALYHRDIDGRDATRT